MKSCTVVTYQPDTCICHVLRQAETTFVWQATAVEPQMSGAPGVCITHIHSIEVEDEEYGKKGKKYVVEQGRQVQRCATSKHPNVQACQFGPYSKESSGA